MILTLGVLFLLSLDLLLPLANLGPETLRF